MTTTTTTTTIAQFLQCKKLIQQNQVLVTTAHHCHFLTQQIQLLVTTAAAITKFHQYNFSFNTIESSSWDHHHHHFLQCKKILSQQGKEKRKQRKPQMAIRFFLGEFSHFFNLQNMILTHIRQIVPISPDYRSQIYIYIYIYILHTTSLLSHMSILVCFALLTDVFVRISSVFLSLFRGRYFG